MNTNVSALTNFGRRPMRRDIIVRAVLKIEWLAVVAAILIGVCHRLIFGWFAPFWIDEAYTGTIASQHSLSGLLNWCKHELSGPFFYFAMWLWEKLSGASDLALRLPSLILSLGAIVVMVSAKELNRRDRLLWAGFAAVWIPGLSYASQARPQALLFLLATIQAVTFIRCMDRCTTARLTSWSILTSLLLLTHLHSVVIGGFQFLFLVWTYRLRLAKFWPALLVFLIPCLWLSIQLPTVLKFMSPGVASYPILHLSKLIFIPTDLFGADYESYIIVIFVLTLLGAVAFHFLLHQKLPPYSRPEATLALSGVLSIVLVMTLGFFHSSYFPRYLVPYFPATLFGLVILLRRAGFGGLLPILVLIGWTLNTTNHGRAYATVNDQQKLNEYEFQRGSNWLMNRGARRVFLIWANPVSGFNDPALQSEMAGFFFRRAGYRAEVLAVHLKPSQLNSSYLAELALSRKAAILWIDDSRYPQAIREIPGLDCVPFGGRRGRSMACDIPYIGAEGNVGQ